MRDEDDSRHRIQISLTHKTLEMLDEMCEANGSQARSNMVEIAVRRQYFTDENTQQMRTMRKLPKR
jgi:metal-responsive CopG/Arc/MetJ family transcriptional regulator